MRSKIILIIIVLSIFSCFKQKEPDAWIVPDNDIEVFTKNNEKNIKLLKFHIYEIFENETADYYFKDKSGKYIIDKDSSVIFDDYSKAEDFSKLNLKKAEKVIVNEILTGLTKKDIDSYKQDYFSNMKFVEYNDDYGISFHYPEKWKTPMSMNQKEDFNDLVSSINKRMIVWDRDGLKVFLNFFHLEDVEKLENNIKNFRNIRKICNTKSVISEDEVYGENIKLINNGFNLLTEYKTFNNENFYGFNTINIGFVIHLPFPSNIQYTEYGYSNSENFGYHITIKIDSTITSELEKIQEKYNWKILGNTMDKYINELVQKESDFSNKLFVAKYIAGSLRWDIIDFNKKMGYNFDDSYLNIDVKEDASRLFKQKKYEEALDLYKEALEIAPYDKNTKTNIGITNYNIGISYYNNQEYEMAKPYFMEAGTFGKKIDNDILINVGLQED